MRIVSIVGARPQFVKLAAICRALAKRETSEHWSHQIIHTGQHYDYEMSQVFFDELAMRAPDVCLEVGSASHGEQTGEPGGAAGGSLGRGQGAALASTSRNIQRSRTSDSSPMLIGLLR